MWKHSERIAPERKRPSVVFTNTLDVSQALIVLGFRYQASARTSAYQAVPPMKLVQKPLRLVTRSYHARVTVKRNSQHTSMG